MPDDIVDPGLPIEVFAFGATERGTENVGMLGSPLAKTTKRLRARAGLPPVTD